MKRSPFVTTEEQEEFTFLVIDKKGFLGGALVKKISSLYSRSTFLCVSASREFSAIPNVQCIGFKKRGMQLPDVSYTHIIVILNEEQEILDLLPQLVTKAKNDNARIWILVKNTSVYAKEVLKIFNSYRYAFCIFTGDYFGKNISLDSSIDIHRFFIQAIQEGRVQVCGMGQKTMYIAELEDVVAAVAREVLEGGSGKIVYAYQKTAPTELTVAGIFHKINPDMAIDFDSERKKDAEVVDREGKYLLDDSYPLQKRVKEMLEEVKNGTVAIKPVSSRTGDRTLGDFLNKKHIALWMIGVFFIPFFTTLLFGILSMGALYAGYALLKNGNVSGAQKAVFAGDVLLLGSSKSARVLTVQLSFVGLSSLGERVENDINLGRSVLQVGEEFLEGFSNITFAIQGESKNPQNDFTQGVYMVKQSLVMYQKFLAEYEAKKDTSLLFTKTFDSRLDSLESLKSIEVLFQNTADVLPQLVGIPESKKYLVVFQNNMELRPGGGFIGSYGLLTLEEGRIKEFSIHDVYDADGQLKAHIEPPFAVRRHLPSAHWYLRDSNFNLDFSKGASVSAYLLNLETKEKVDGVIGVDTAFIKNLLKATGPLYVADYQETVDYNNFYTLTQEYVQKNFFPGSTQKKDFLRSLFASLEHRVLQEKKISYADLLKIINDMVEQKHLLFAFSNTAIQSLFEVSNASSGLSDTRRVVDNTINDYLYVNEANLGVNKVNFYIKRKISQLTTIEENGQINSNLTLMYKNNSKDLDYKAYVQIATPLNSILSSIVIDGVEQEIIPAVTDPRVYESKKFQKPIGLEVETYEQSGKTIHGFLITAKRNALHSVVLRYSLQEGFLVSNPVSTYSYKVVKQPGTDDDTYSFSLIYPSVLRVLEKSSLLSQEGEKFSLDTKLHKDMELQIRFAPR